MARPIVVFVAESLRLAPPLTEAEAASLRNAFALDLFDRFARHRAPYALGVAADPSERAWFAEHAPRDATIFESKGRALVGEAFAGGFGPLAILGTNVPTLPAARVDRLVEPLVAEPRAADVTIGLDRAGGWWGLGLAAPSPALVDLAESGNGSVALATLRRAAEAGLRVEKVGSWGGVATIDDLAALATELRDARVRESAPRTAAAVERLGFLPPWGAP
ncbi:MAG TPA: DUF2064 domain-containing protein [Planctomycetota bacterium]|nr:DUF2064 domain-containing protein [Planctomycetota bacterium]